MSNIQWTHTQAITVLLVPFDIPNIKKHQNAY